MTASIPNTVTATEERRAPKLLKETPRCQTGTGSPAPPSNRHAMQGNWGFPSYMDFPGTFSPGPMSPRRTVEPKPRAVDQQNRIALPPEAMAALGIKQGDFVTFEIEGNSVRLHKVRWVVDGKR